MPLQWSVPDIDPELPPLLASTQLRGCSPQKAFVPQARSRVPQLDSSPRPAVVLWHTLSLGLEEAAILLAGTSDLWLLAWAESRARCHGVSEYQPELVHLRAVSSNGTLPVRVPPASSLPLQFVSWVSTSRGAGSSRAR